MRHAILVLLASSLLAACAGFGPHEAPASPVDGYQVVEVAGQKATRRERSRCETVGGIIRQDGLAGWERCIQTMPDAGKTCTSSTECVQSCVITGRFVEMDTPTTGQCAETDSPFGCFQVVEDGLAAPALCVD